jgi:predicted metal-dependent hydrolase
MLLRTLFDLEPPREQPRDFLLADGRIATVRWVRDARARRLKLTVGERGARLTLPPRASIRLAEEFMLEHRAWLTEQLAKQTTAERARLLPGQAATLPLRGAEWPVEWRTGRYARVEREPDRLAIALPARATDRHLRAALRDYYEREARVDLGAWLPRYLPGLPRAPLAVRLRPMTSLWGSLSPGDGLSLDLSLVLGRPSAFEYVVVHELCHLIHRDHSRRFWREVEDRSPDWRAERDYLHGQGLAMKRALAQLLA